MLIEMKKFLSVILAAVIMAGIFVFPAFASNTEIFTVSGTNAGGTVNNMTASFSRERWSAVENSYIFKSANGYTAVDYNGSKVIATEYDRNFKAVSSKTIEPELSLFGGFYAASDYNYILYGDTNYAEEDTKEVLRLVRYDKDFNRVDSGSVRDCYTYEPFESGSASIAETNGYIFIHTSRLRFADKDSGFRHQSQLTVIMDKATLGIRNDLGQFQPNHVSHSFNQFVIADGKKFILADHGDAYPRAIAINELDTESGYYKGTSSMFDIPGAQGANCTGVTLGGIAASSSSYLAVINTIDHSKATSYDSFKIYGLTKDERDAAVLVKPKNGDKAETVYLTDYVDRGMLASTPRIVKINDDEFAVLWQEFTLGSSGDGILRFAVIDGRGNVKSKGSSSSAVLSKDCQPIYDSGRIIWYVNTGSSERKIYKLDVFDSSPDTPSTPSQSEYTLIFKADDNIILKTTRKAGETIYAPTTPVKTGYTFTGWEPAVPSSMPAKDMTFTAKFVKNSDSPDTPVTPGSPTQTYYSATFTVDGNIVSKLTRKVGDAVVRPSDPVKPGYTFVRWEPEVPATMPAKNITFSAVFTENTDTPDNPYNPTPSVPENPDPFASFNIKNHVGTLSVGYNSTIIFHTTIEAPYGYSIVWSNGQTGSRCEIDNVTSGSYIIYASLMKNGVVIKETAKETVTVRTGFFARLIAFFRTLIGIDSVYEDNARV